MKSIKLVVISCFLCVSPLSMAVDHRTPICHDGVSKTVPNIAVPMHMLHGDCVGTCADCSSLLHSRYYTKIGFEDFVVNDNTDLRVSLQIEIWQGGVLVANVGSEVFWNDNTVGEVIFIPFNDAGFEDFASYATDDINDCILIRTVFGSGGEEDEAIFTERTWWLKELSLENDLVGFTLDYIQLTMDGVCGHSTRIDLIPGKDPVTCEDTFSVVFNALFEFFGREN